MHVSATELSTFSSPTPPLWKASYNVQIEDTYGRANLHFAVRYIAACIGVMLMIQRWDRTDLSFISWFCSNFCWSGYTLYKWYKLTTAYSTSRSVGNLHILLAISEHGEKRIGAGSLFHLVVRRKEDWVHSFFRSHLVKSTDCWRYASCDRVQHFWGFCVSILICCEVRGYEPFGRSILVGMKRSSLWGAVAKRGSFWENKWDFLFLEEFASDSFSLSISEIFQRRFVGMNCPPKNSLVANLTSECMLVIDLLAPVLLALICALNSS